MHFFILKNVGQQGRLMANKEDDEEWRPESPNDSVGSTKITEKEMQRLASEIGINYKKPRPQKVLKTRPLRQRKKPLHFTPRESIRDFRGESRRRKSKHREKMQAVSYTGIKGKRKNTNVFGGINAKKQRSIFQTKFSHSVHRPLDVYNGK